MSTHNQSSAISEAVVRQAIAWRVKLESRGQDSDTLEACAQWRLAQPDHERAWQRLSNLDATFGKVAEVAPSIAKQTLLNTDNEVESMSRRQALKTLGGSICGAMAVSWLSYEQGVLDPLYADHVTRADKSLITLTDESQLWLNQHSSVIVKFTDTLRNISIPRGEIHLTTTAEQRPFQVLFQHGVLNTQQAKFNLREQDSSSFLQVDDGEVWIQANNGYARKITAGEVVEFSKYGSDLLPADLFDYSAWVDGVLSVRDIPLKRLLAELARYRVGVLRNDPRLDNHLISGVFQLHDHDLILKTLARTVNAQLSYRSKYWVSLS